MRATLHLLVLASGLLLRQIAAGADRGGEIKVIESPRPYQLDNVVIGGGGWFTCLVPHPKIPNLLWLGSDVSGPWKREPGDNRWRAQAWNRWTPRNSSGVLSLALDPRNELTVYVERADSTGSMGPSRAERNGLYVTRDGGKNWSL